MRGLRRSRSSGVDYAPFRSCLSLEPRHEWIALPIRAALAPMSTTVLVVGAAIVAKAALVTALVVQRRKNKQDEETVREQKRLTHLARVAIVGELSGGLAHELNQPLTSILSNAQAAQHALQSDKVDLAEVREILADIVAEDKRASELIGRLRTLLKHEEPTMQQVETNALLKEAQCLVRSSLTAHQVTLSSDIESGLPQVLGDPIQLQQVLLNLLLNACDAVRDCEPADRRIELSARLESAERRLHVTVIDRGHGIAADGLDRVFDAFFTTKPNGLGLGLAICRQIACAHGGRLWATHNGDRGAAFHLTLPVMDEVRHVERSTG
jgi:two-component system sensor kinase FixL